MKRVRWLHAPQKHKLKEVRLAGCFVVRTGKGRTAPQMPALIANAGQASRSLVPGPRYAAATITCA
jgi:hypothetical protein